MAASCHHMAESVEFFPQCLFYVYGHAHALLLVRLLKDEYN